MKHLLELLDTIEETVYPTTDKGRIRQKEQTELKMALTNAFVEDLKDMGLEVLEVQKGFALLLQNHEEGAIPVEVNIVTKPLDYDAFGLHDEFMAKQNKE